MKTILALLALTTFALHAIGAESRDPNPDLTKIWVDGYMHDFRRHAEDVQTRTPLVAEIPAGKGDPTGTVKIRIEDSDSELISEIVELVLADVESTVRSRYWVNDSGQLEGGRISQISGIGPHVILRWKASDYASVGFAIDRNKVTAFGRWGAPPKGRVLDAHHRPCSHELINKMVEILQPAS